jgi:hypothetical protein
VRQLRVVDHSFDALRELMLTAAALRHRGTFRDPQDHQRRARPNRSLGGGPRQPRRARRLPIAREFDIEIERAAVNPTLEHDPQPVDRRPGAQGRSVEWMRTHPEAGMRRVQGRQDILGALRSRDSDLVEQVLRRQAFAGVELLLNDLDQGP